MNLSSTRISLLGALVGFSACGGSESDPGNDPNSTNSAAFPLGFAVSSPLAKTTNGKRDTGVGAVTISPNKTFAQKVADLQALATATTPDECKVSLGPVMGGSPYANCYGPSLDFTNHPDGNPSSGMLPGGDIGLWTATENGQEACAAAQLNALIGSVANKVDSGLYVTGALLCAANTSGHSLPDQGSSLTLTTELQSALSLNNQLSVTSATLVGLAGDEYEYNVAMTVNGVTIETHMRHQLNANASDAYRGKIWSSLSGLNGGPSQTFAYSVLYERTASNLRYRLASAGYPTNAGDMFDVDGNIKPNSNWNGNFSLGLFDLDDATASIGSVSYAWQAGTGDSHARVFNAYTKSAGSDMAGCGFFGYGPRVDNSSGVYPASTIERFICNWAGPANNHNTNAHMAQKQCMTKASSDPFYSLTESHITFAPVNDCDSTGSAFSYKLPNESVFTTTPLVMDLVDLTTDADFANDYTAPTPPSDF